MKKDEESGESVCASAKRLRKMTLAKTNDGDRKCAYGAIPFARDEAHDKVIEMMGKEPRGKVLDVPTGAGALAGRLKKMGFEVSCCDINPSYFSVPDLKV